MNQPAPAKQGGSLVMYVVGSCFGLGVAGALGSIGYGGAVLGVLGLAGCIALLVKVARFRIPAIVASVLCLFMICMGVSRGKAQSDDAAAAAQQAEAEKKRQEAAKARAASATALVMSVQAEAPLAERVRACTEALQGAGTVPVEKQSVCGAAFLEQGRALIGEDNLAAGVVALERAKKLVPQDAEVDAALVAAKYSLLVRAATDQLAASQLSMSSKEYGAAATTARSAQRSAQQAVALMPSDKAARDLAAKADAQVKLAGAAHVKVVIGESDGHVRAAKASLSAKDSARAKQSLQSATAALSRVRADNPNDPGVKAAAARIDVLQKQIDKAAEKDAQAAQQARFIKESCAKVSNTFGTSSRLSDLQKEELWKKYTGQEFAWDLEVTEVSSDTFGGYTVQFKCGYNSPSLIQDIQISYPEKYKAMALDLEKGSIYKIEGRLKHTSTLFGMTAEPM